MPSTEIVEPVEYTERMTIRLDRQSLRKLESMGLFERKKPAVLARDIILDKIQVYERYPAFKRFLKQLDEQKKTR